ncbi:MAG: histone deacetylase family protein [Candidatus Hodarchaeota archaeon]
MVDIEKRGLIPWHPDYLLYSFGSDHPLQSDKLQIFIDKVHSSSLPLDIQTFVTPIVWKDIEPVVQENLLIKLKKMSETGKGQVDASTPAFLNMLYPARLSCQGTYLALKNVLLDRYQFSFNCLGGLHHAGPNFVGGGCLFNDMAVAINKIRIEGNRKSRIAIIDCDYHLHDGTLAYFGGDPMVFTASIHENGWVGGEKDNEGWGKGMGTNINWEIKEPISGSEYLTILREEILPPIQQFNPELIFFLNGVDAHSEDPVTANYMHRPFSLSDENYAELADIIADFALEVCEGKIVGLGAGGYSSEITSRVWVQTVHHFANKLL